MTGNMNLPKFKIGETVRTANPAVPSPELTVVHIGAHYSYTVSWNDGQGISSMCLDEYKLEPRAMSLDEWSLMVAKALVNVNSEAYRDVADVIKKHWESAP